MHRICRKAGAERVSKGAAVELARFLEEVGVDIAREAVDFARHAGRKTVKARDIKIAFEKTFGSKRRL